MALPLMMLPVMAARVLSQSPLRQPSHSPQLGSASEAGHLLLLFLLSPLQQMALLSQRLRFRCSSSRPWPPLLLVVLVVVLVSLLLLLWLQECPLHSHSHSHSRLQ